MRREGKGVCGYLCIAGLRLTCMGTAMFLSLYWDLKRSALCVCVCVCERERKKET